MKNRTFGRKIRISIIIFCTINIFVSFIWFHVKLKPFINTLQDTRVEVNNKLNKENFENLNLLIASLDDISSKYKLTYSLSTIDENIKVVDKNTKDILVLNKLIKIKDEVYMVTFYPNYKINIMVVMIEFFAFEIMFVVITFFLMFIIASKKIVRPIDIIINDIKNYKKGIKPVKCELKNEFGTIQNEFIELTDELEEEKKEQSRIISSISHDLKTPLTSIMGYSNLINDEETSLKEIKEYNNKIISKANHMKNLLEAFDDYLINKTNTTLKKKKIKLNDLIKDIKDDYEIELKNKNIKLEIKSTSKSEYLNIDYMKVKRIFSNIISNSVRYIDKDGLIQINISDTKNGVKFKISDNGKGVNEEIIGKIFDPLFTTDNSRKMSGLGLSICREFIELHGGNINAYNNNGLTIEFVIPYDKENA